MYISLFYGHLNLSANAFFTKPTLWDMLVKTQVISVFTQMILEQQFLIQEHPVQEGGPRDPLRSF